jgi:hypothetical protein
MSIDTCISAAGESLTPYIVPSHCFAASPMRVMQHGVDFDTDFRARRETNLTQILSFLPTPAEVYFACSLMNVGRMSR